MSKKVKKSVTVFTKTGSGRGRRLGDGESRRNELEREVFLKCV